MQQQIYSIYDTKLQAFFSPFTAQNNDVARRNFQDLANDQNSRIAQHPTDYQLIQIGQWNDSTGEIQATDHANLGFASEYTNDDSP
ncbi:nonstructural protein [Microviridae sp.]|nr:nonstructural protein [Microviridae sp.]